MVIIYILVHQHKIKPAIGNRFMMYVFVKNIWMMSAHIQLQFCHLILQVVFDLSNWFVPLISWILGF